MKEWRKQYKDLIEAPLEEQHGPKSREELSEMKMPYEDYCKAMFAPGHEMGKPESLKGIRWMSTTMYIFTPHSVANLAELGAEVYKFEM
ncbi:MAG: CoA transferase, partial [Deltaproteobacteria bacterium]